MTVVIPHDPGLGVLWALCLEEVFRRA